jgi:hypothetical protein
MIAPGSATLSPQHRPASPKAPIAGLLNSARGAGAVAGNRERASMPHDPNTLHLTYDEAETVAGDLRRVWTGMTGLREVPPVEQLTDLVQRTVRKAREIVTERSE